MATIEIDLGFFIVETILVFFLPPIAFLILIRSAYKSKEFWMRLKRLDYVYAQVLNAVGVVQFILIPLKDIAADGTFRMFGKREYHWPMTTSAKGKPGGRTIDSKTGNPIEPLEEEKKAGQLLFPYKKKTMALFRYNDSNAQLWAPGNTIFSITDPGMLDSIGEGKDLKLMITADSMTRLMRMALGVSIIAALISIGTVIGLVLTAQTSAQGFDKLYHVLNSTRTGP